MTQALILANALAFCDSSVASQAAAELRAQHARIAELESTLEAIGAGGVEPLRKTAAAPQAVPASVIAGAVFDFSGYLTTLPHKEAIHCSEAHEAAPMVEAITEWCKRRNLTTDGAKVETWRDHLAEAPAHPAEGVPAQDSEAKIGELLALARIMVRAALDADNKTQVQEIKAAIESEIAFERALRAALTTTQPAAQGMDALTPAARDVLAERKRQIETEGWQPERDDVYDTGEMALAAACYAAHSASCAAIKAPHTARGVFARTRSAQDFVGEMWPWSADWWKPSDHRRNLEKAAALILAEIERMDRSFAAQAKQGGV